MHDHMVIELAPFTVHAGVDDAAVLAAAERLEREFLVAMPGYLGRALTRQPDGRWMDVVLCATQSDAEAVMAHISASEACAAYFSLMQGADTMDPASGVMHLHALRTFGRLAQH